MELYVRETMILRPPKVDEFDKISALCCRSKAFWGYDEAFIDICRDVLCVDPQLAASGLVIVAELNQEIVGVAQVSITGDAAELDVLFVEPHVIRGGIGCTLFDWAVTRARECGAADMLILSDPNARGFYENMGASFVKMAPSDVIAGRKIPLLSYPLTTE